MQKLAQKILVLNQEKLWALKLPIIFQCRIELQLIEVYFDDRGAARDG